MTIRHPLTAALLALAFAWASPLALSQKLSLKDVGRMYTAGSGAIADDKGNVAGYYFLYSLDADNGRGGEGTYALKITDANLETKQTKRITVDRGTVAVDADFNGDAICITLHNPREREFTLLTYDRDGERLGKVTTEISAKEYRVLATMGDLTSDDPSLSLVYAIPGEGFVMHVPTEDKGYGFAVSMYDNALKKRWTVESDPKRAKYQVGSFLSASAEYVFTSGLEKESMMNSKGMRTVVYAHAVADGTQAFAVDATTTAPSMIPTNAFFDAGTETVMLAGMYYPRDADPVKDNSTGVAVKRLDMNGKMVAKGTVNWTQAFAKIGRAKTEHLKKGGALYVHDVITRPGGGLAVVGEYYDKDISAMGVASALLGGGAGAASIYVQDMIVVELDAALELADAHLFAKPQHEVMLPAGSSMMGPGVLAMFIKTYGGFDYSYAQDYADGKGSLMAYTSRRKKEKGLGSEDYLNFVVYDAGSGKYAETDFRLETEATSINFYEAKPGYIMVSEYDKKAKRIDARLERVD